MQKLKKEEKEEERRMVHAWNWMKGIRV